MKRYKALALTVAGVAVGVLGHAILEVGIVETTTGLTVSAIAALGLVVAALGAIASLVAVFTMQE